MPAGKRQQSNAMLYTLLTFVGLFILSTAVAIIYYINYEDQRQRAADAEEQRRTVVNQSEFANLGKIVGETTENKTYLGKMAQHLDNLDCLIMGGATQDTSAQEKDQKANRIATDMLKGLAQKGLVNSEVAKIQGLIPTIKALENELDNRQSKINSLQQTLDQLDTQYNDSLAIMKERENQLKTDKEQYKQQVDEIKAAYENLKSLLAQNSEERVSSLVMQLDNTKKQLDETRQNLLKTEAQKNMIENKMNQFKDQLAKIVPDPDTDVAAYKPDGEVMLLDTATKTVHLNIGSDDNVYRGLTFTVYNKGLAIPKNGKGKAEIEVYDIKKNVSVARILKSEFRNPIVLGDIVANLIWDSDQQNQFVIAGDFDLDSNGSVDPDAQDKITGLIKEWGGSTADNVSIETDYLILGKTPRVLKRPDLQQMEIDPMAMEKYQKSLDTLDQYNKAKQQANTLRIPIFNYERFLYFIGYKSQAPRPEAF